MGGYVKMFGDEDAASAKSSTENVPADQVQYTFMGATVMETGVDYFCGAGDELYLGHFVVGGDFVFYWRGFYPARGWSGDAGFGCRRCRNCRKKTGFYPLTPNPLMIIATLCGRFRCQSLAKV